jgi:integrase
MTWDEVDLATATWTIPASRMKAGKPHVVPLSDQALAILRGQYETRGKNPHVFPSHLPRQALWSASLALVMRRLGANACGPLTPAFHSRSPSNALPTPSAMR